MRIFKRKNWLDSEGGQPDSEGNFRKPKNNEPTWLSLMIRNFLAESKEKK